jgi:hypothetical protein
MSSLRSPHPTDQRSDGAGRDADIIIQGPGGPFVDTGSSIPLPVGMLDAAREFGRRGDRDGFRRFVSRCNSDVRNWQRLQLEFDRAVSGEDLPAWKRVWRYAVAPQLSTRGLEALRKALHNDDKRLLQGATTSPPSLQCVQDWPVEACDAICFAGWQSEGLHTVAQVEEFFAKVCFDASSQLGDPTAIRYYLNWWDEQPRDVVRQQLLIEVDLALIGRLPQEADTPLAKLLAESIRLAERKEGAA